ncbi:MAG: DNA/RNA nuclease SfsA [Thermodesulfovibrionales bacterium]|nr:DNA/RNA nuclease SfsA [Thermodesulfovibrionales bacterium]
MPIDIFSKDLLEADFIRRPNRFVVKCLLKGKEVDAYLPNPGRLFELLIEGAKIYLIKTQSGSLSYKAVAVLKDTSPVMIDTHANNIVLKELLQKGLIKGLENYDSIHQEIKVANSRFDFLIQKGFTSHYIEAKSCTLFGDKIAMFPDAVTQRGTRHLNELMRLSQQGHRCHVIFIVHSPDVLYFMPEYHTDLDFSNTFIKVSSFVDIKAIGINWERNLQLSEEVRHLNIPFDFLQDEIKDRGAYLLILKLPHKKSINIGALGNMEFQKGYYIYVGSAMKDLTHRIARHRRKHKNNFWHIDYLIQNAQFITALPIRDNEKIECLIAKKMFDISEYSIANFGSSDCDCKSHLFYMKAYPLIDKKFIKNLIWLRIDRITEKLKSES